MHWPLVTFITSRGLIFLLLGAASWCFLGLLFYLFFFRFSATTGSGFLGASLLVFSAATGGAAASWGRDEGAGVSSALVGFPSSLIFSSAGGATVGGAVSEGAAGGSTSMAVSSPAKIVGKHFEQIQNFHFKQIRTYHLNIKEQSICWMPSPTFQGGWQYTQIKS